MEIVTDIAPFSHLVSCTQFFCVLFLLFLVLYGSFKSSMFNHAVNHIYVLLLLIWDVRSCLHIIFAFLGFSRIRVRFNATFNNILVWFSHMFYHFATLTNDYHFFPSKLTLQMTINKHQRSYAAHRWNNNWRIGAAVKRIST